MAAMYKIIGADGKEYGPVPAEVLRQWLDEGRANAQSKVRPDGAADWMALGELPEFRSAPGEAVPQPIRPLATPAPSATNPLALTGLILGIISVAFSLCCYGLPFNVAGLIISLIALGQTKAPDHQGRGMAIAGLVLSLLSILLALVLLVLVLAFGFANPMHRIHRL